MRRTLDRRLFKQDAGATGGEPPEEPTELPEEPTEPPEEPTNPDADPADAAGGDDSEQEPAWITKLNSRLDRLEATLTKHSQQSSQRGQSNPSDRAGVREKTPAPKSPTLKVAPPAQVPDPLPKRSRQGKKLLSKLRKPASDAGA